MRGAALGFGLMGRPAVVRADVWLESGEMAGLRVGRVSGCGLCRSCCRPHRRRALAPRAVRVVGHFGFV
eukprot:6236455-Alexandrium_andersonii.AAC.1